MFSPLGRVVSRPPTLTTTSYAVLGLLAVRPRSTYELTRQVERSLGRFWPRAASKLYEEPKKLVAAGLATAAADRVGRRPRTVYTITPEGRRALAAWLASPPKGPELESEALLRVAFAADGSKADLVHTLEATRAWAAERNDGNRAAAEHLAGQAASPPSRAAQSLLVGAFLTDFYALVARWTDEAMAEVRTWPDDLDQAPVSPAVLEQVRRRAAWS